MKVCKSLCKFPRIFVGHLAPFFPQPLRVMEKEGMTQFPKLSQFPFRIERSVNPNWTEPFTRHESYRCAFRI
jgi:hypothetical protein